MRAATRQEEKDPRMSSRRALIALVSAVVAALMLPAVASAHHLDNNASTVVCEGAGPTLTIKAVFVDFEDYNKPVNYSVDRDGTVIDQGTFTWTGPSYTKVLAYPTGPGQHEVTFKAWWGSRYSGGSGSFNRTVVCPTPPPPPPPPTVTPPPPPTVTPPPPAPPTVYDCHGNPLPPGSTPPTCKPRKSGKCVPYPKSRFRLTITPSMSDITHGRVTFQVRGPHIKWVRFHVDHRWAKTDRSRPFKTSVWLWQEDVWGLMPQPLWGRHTISATIRTKCGVVRLAKKVFNHDPLPEGGTLKRSSWS